MMKKIIFVVALVLMPVGIALAASSSFSLTPTSLTATEGRTFTVAVGFDPGGTTIYTAKLALLYPADLLEVKSFSWTGNVMPLSQPGYDNIDNTAGALVKTAGFPGGTSSGGPLATVTFRTKAAGAGAVEVGAGSLAYDASNTNVLGGNSPSVAVTVKTALAAVPTPKPSPAPAQEEQVIAPTPSVTTAPTSSGEVAAVAASVSGQQIPFGAAVGTVLTLGTNNVIVGTLIALILLVILVYAGYAFVTRNKNGGS